MGACDIYRSDNSTSVGKSYYEPKGNVVVRLAFRRETMLWFGSAETIVRLDPTPRQSEASDTEHEEKAKLRPPQPGMSWIDAIEAVAMMAGK